MSQTVEFAPDVRVLGSNIGKGREVLITVKDERTKKILGRRGSGFGPAASITTTQDLPKIILKRVKSALKAYNFKPVESGSISRSLSVEIRAVEYDTSMGFASSGVHVRASLKADGKNGVSVFEKFYRAEKDKRIIIVPTAKSNAKFINEVLSQALENLINDQELLDFLADESVDNRKTYLPPVEIDKEENIYQGEPLISEPDIVVDEDNSEYESEVQGEIEKSVEDFDKRAQKIREELEKLKQENLERK
ncbi:MAG: hypothetical protein KAI03_07790 [Candidatus Aureabacteria bacterium]|nr:hypothetical protein [Candidatus Auribacterota bacterium]